jgi:hypothetical protein
MSVRLAGVAVVLLLVAGCSDGEAGSAGPVLDVETFEEQQIGVFLSDTAVRQILDGEIEPPLYNSDPPTSGPHSAKAAACGIFRQAVPDVYQVHNLAMGVVLIQYSPSLEAVDVERIEEFGRTFEDRLIVAPRPGMGAQVVATAWTKMMAMDAIDEERLKAFYEQYAGGGPEPGPCPFSVDEGA